MASIIKGDTKWLPQVLAVSDVTLKIKSEVVQVDATF